MCNLNSHLINEAPAPPVQFAIHTGVRLVGHVFPPKLPGSLRGLSPSRNTLFLGPSQTASRSVQSFVHGSQILCCTMPGKKTLQTVPSPWDFVTLSGEDQATGIGNMQNTLVKIAGVVSEISSQTDRHTYSLQYFTASPRAK